MGNIKTFMMKQGYRQNSQVMYPDSLCPCQTARQWKDPYKLLERESMRIRKLTPTECERLQGFPQDLTKFGRRSNGGVYTISDTQRYKMCGNAVSSNAAKTVIESFIPDEEIQIMSLFSGCGGTEAALSERFKVIGHCEIDKYAQDVLRFNHPEVPIFGDVIKLANQEEIIETRFNLLTFGYPCQDISIAGKGLGEQGSRSSLVYQVVEIVRKYRPKYLFAENVKNHLSSKHEAFFLRVLTEFSKLGYSLDFEVVNTCNFGSPQNRERVYILGKRND